MCTVIFPLVTNLWLAGGAAEFKGIREARSVIARREMIRMFLGLKFAHVKTNRKSQYNIGK